MNKTTDQINLQNYKHLVTKQNMLHQTKVKWEFSFVDRDGHRQFRVMSNRKRLINLLAFMVEELGYEVVGNELHSPS